MLNSASVRKNEPHPAYGLVEEKIHLFRTTARTVLELGAELISSDIIAFYELIKNGLEIRFDIVLPRHPYLKLREALTKRSPLGVTTRFVPKSYTKG